MPSFEWMKAVNKAHIHSAAADRITSAEWERAAGDPEALLALMVRKSAEAKAEDEETAWPGPLSHGQWRIPDGLRRVRELNAELRSDSSGIQLAEGLSELRSIIRWLPYERGRPLIDRWRRIETLDDLKALGARAESEFAEVMRSAGEALAGFEAIAGRPVRSRARKLPCSPLFLGMMIGAVVAGLLADAWDVLVVMSLGSGVVGLWVVRREVARTRRNPLLASGLGLDAAAHPWRAYPAVFLIWSLCYLGLASLVYGCRALTW